MHPAKQDDLNMRGQLMSTLSATGRSSRARRQIAISLLVGWLAFWFTTAAQACCFGFPADHGAIGLPAATPAGAPGGPWTGSSPLPSVPDIDCDALSAIGPVVPGAALPPADGTDLPAAARREKAPAAVARASEYLSFGTPDHPLSGLPPYLRLRRLLI